MTTGSAPCHILVSRATGRREGTIGGKICAFSTCRNERLRLPAFLEHYRGLGVDRFFIVDNDSSDGTRQFLADQPDVHLFLTAARHSESNSGADWMNALLAEFGIGSWCVTVDIDELLVYPGSEHTPLPSLTRHLDRSGCEALACLLLDVYPASTLKDCVYHPGDRLLAAAPFFDSGPYHRMPVERCPSVHISGGMRERVFYPEFRTRGLGTKIYDALFHRIALRAPILRDRPWLHAWRPPRPPCLTKVPLVRWKQQSRYLAANHWISPQMVAPETGVLLHFKFLQDFHDRVVREAEGGGHTYEAYEYRRYAERNRRDPDLTLMYEGSTRFEGTMQLVRLGLMHDTEAWADARGQAIR
jgi:Glycosyl transferase family 2